jgi:hypothetical protein
MAELTSKGGPLALPEDNYLVWLEFDRHSPQIRPFVSGENWVRVFDSAKG